MRVPQVVRRWIAFNGVGAMGVVVQLSTLAVLSHGAGLHYLAATVVAVEAAVLHNFLWHQRWTWRDRPAASAAGTLARLGRFHLLNGLVSMAGNVVVTAVLTGGLGADPVIASAIAIALCSIANFFASEVLVFKTAATVLVLLTVASDAPRAGAASEPLATLQPQTVAAWKQYEQQVDERYRKVGTSGTFFVHDEYGKGTGWRTEARGGTVAMLELNAPSPSGKQLDVPDGRIHHWVGAVFIPDTTVDAVVKRLQDRAGHESESYEDVLASKLLERNGDRLRVFMKLRRDSVITVTYNTEHTVEYRRLGDARASSRSVATKIAELTDAGTPQERERPSSNDRGFLWRLNAYWRYEQTAGGVLIECESVSLSRSVPFLIRPLVNGMVEGIARESLQKTLVSLRAALTGVPRRTA